MNSVGALERDATVEVDRGLYILKYETGAASGVSPVAVARPAPGSEPFIEVISAPGIVSGFLSAPGECVVIRAERSGRLVLKITRRTPNESLDASFRLDPVPGAQRAPSAEAPRFGVSRGVDASDRLALLAHVARRGDIRVSAGEWAAGPSAPSVIEGFAIGGALPAGVRIEAQPLVGTTPPRWLEWVDASRFVGSRGRALALAGVRLRLVGEDASRFVILAEALFLGSAIMSKRGREIELVGPAGGDPLVGLRFDLDSETDAIRAPNPVIAQRRAEPRVKVFRAAVNG